MGKGRGGGVEGMWIMAFKGFKKFSGGGGGGWSPSENSVCPRPLLQFLQLCQSGYVCPQFLQFRSVRLRQFTLEGQDLELDNISVSINV